MILSLNIPSALLIYPSITEVNKLLAIRSLNSSIILFFS